MTTLTEQPKICPSCRRPAMVSEGKKIVSRSSGKNTISWRCKSCVEKSLKR